MASGHLRPRISSITFAPPTPLDPSLSLRSTGQRGTRSRLRPIGFGDPSTRGLGITTADLPVIDGARQDRLYLPTEAGNGRWGRAPHLSSAPHRQLELVPSSLRQFRLLTNRKQCDGPTVGSAFYQAVLRSVLARREGSRADTGGKLLRIVEARSYHALHSRRNFPLDPGTPSQPYDDSQLDRSMTERQRHHERRWDVLDPSKCDWVTRQSSLKMVTYRHA